MCCCWPVKPGINTFLFRLTGCCGPIIIHCMQYALFLFLATTLKTLGLHFIDDGPAQISEEERKKSPIFLNPKPMFYFPRMLSHISFLLSTHYWVRQTNHLQSPQAFILPCRGMSAHWLVALCSDNHPLHKDTSHWKQLFFLVTIQSMTLRPPWQL